MNSILSEIKYVVDNSEDVKINAGAIDSIADNFSSDNKIVWHNILPFVQKDLTLKQRISFNFISNAINFSYWGNPKWKINYQNKELDGFWALNASIQRAIEEGYDILNPKYLENISIEDFENIFRGNIEIPLAKERLKILRELGKIILSDFGGEFENILTESDYDAEKILDILISKFYFFDDNSVYRNKKIHFHKKAQLLIGDIYELLGKTNNKIKNIKFLTAFADYKIPQILRKLDVLIYSRGLTNIIDKKIEIESGNPMEVEIRANMIWAVELIKEKINKKYPNINAMDIDHWLWVLSQNKKQEDKPYHLTRTIYY